MGEVDKQITSNIAMSHLPSEIYDLTIFHSARLNQRFKILKAQLHKSLYPGTERCPANSHDVCGCPQHLCCPTPPPTTPTPPEPCESEKCNSCQSVLKYGPIKSGGCQDSVRISYTAEPAYSYIVQSRFLPIVS